MLLIGADQKEGVDNMPTNEEYNQAVNSTTLHSKKVRKLCHMNEMAFEDLIFSVNHKSMTGKIAFHLIKNCKNDKYPEGNCLVWMHLIEKYAPRSAPSLLSLGK